MVTAFFLILAGIYCCYRAGVNFAQYWYHDVPSTPAETLSLAILYHCAGVFAINVGLNFIWGVW